MIRRLLWKADDAYTNYRIPGMIVTDKGIIIRIALDHVGVYGRNTQGVKLINVADDETVTKVAVVAKNEEEQSEE